MMVISCFTYCRISRRLDSLLFSFEIRYPTQHHRKYSLIPLINFSPADKIHDKQHVFNCRRDSERSRELQEKNECLVREMQELRQKHAEELRKLQRELQSSQDTRKNMTEEIRGRDTEISELKNQLNERSIALKRSENVLSSVGNRKQFIMLQIVFLLKEVLHPE